MGGFIEYEGNRPIRVLLPEQLESYSLTGNGDFPRISKVEIEGKSKGDAISKTVVILHVYWFMIQPVARLFQRLPITELELTTVVFATLSIGIYSLLWNKPQNVQCGVRVYKRQSTEEAVDDGDAETTVGYLVALGDALSDIPPAILRGPSSDYIDSWLVRVLTWPFMKPLSIILPTDGHEPEDEKRVDTFYPNTWVQRPSGLLSFVFVTYIALNLSGIYCVGWFFEFPSYFERTVWRVASLSGTGIPIVLFLLVLFAAPLGEVKQFSEFCRITVAVLLLSFYLLSRLTLVVLTFLTLGSLPPAAFQVAHWTAMIPHL